MKVTTTGRTARAAARLLVVAAATVAAAASAATLTRGPYLQLLGTHAVTVVWQTDVPAACAVALAPLGGGEPTVAAGGAGTTCVVPVPGLVPGTPYGYVPLADGEALGPGAAFRTDHPTRPFVFLAVGDTGDGGAAQHQVRDRMLESPRDLIVHTGDMIYPEATPERWDPKFFAPYAALVEALVFWPCLGNHDVEADGGASWRDAFLTPANNPSFTEHYCSFDYGNAHFVVLDSNASLAVGSPQHDFLDADLAASAARWKFVVFHHPVFSSSGSSTQLRASLVPVFDRWGVDVVFQGHRHNYERTKPLRGGAVVAPGEGTVYVTTGGGGRALTTAGTSSWTAYSESTFHFTRVAVDGDVLELEMVRGDGTIGDATTLVKETPTTTTTTLPGCG